VQTIKSWKEFDRVFGLLEVSQTFYPLYPIPKHNNHIFVILKEILGCHSIIKQEKKTLVKSFHPLNLSFSSRSEFWPKHSIRTLSSNKTLSPFLREKLVVRILHVIGALEPKIDERKPGFLLRQPMKVVIFVILIVE
jgi:hypothetical protein